MTPREKAERRAVAKAADRIISIYLTAEDWEHEAGARWYGEESARLQGFALRHRVSFDAACGAASAISPGMRWEFVPAHLAALVKNPKHTVPTYSREFVRRALAILRGADPLDTLGGPKTRAFYSLLAGRDMDAVVVDGHAWNIARGVPSPIRDNVPSAGRVTPKRYRIAAAAYRQAAEVLGCAPHAVQATTWIYWRRMLDVASPETK
jgi:hypothetical protein